MNNSDYFTTMPGADVVDENLQLEYRVSCKALNAALSRHHEVSTKQATDMDEMLSRRLPAGSRAYHELLNRVAHQRGELEDLTARITNLRASIAHVLELAHRQANERVAAEILAYGRSSNSDEGPQEGGGSFVIRER